MNTTSSLTIGQRMDRLSSELWEIRTMVRELREHVEGLLAESEE